MLRVVLPKGSLEQATMELFTAADLAVQRSMAVDYRATIDDPRIAEGTFDLGITGRDWIEEQGAKVHSLGRLGYSKATDQPIRIVLAVHADSPVRRAEDLPAGSRISTEYPNLTSAWLAERGIHADVRLSYGATEAKVPEIADAVVELTETGKALRAAGLRIIDVLLESYTELVANPLAVADPVKAHAMDQLMTLLQGALEARGKVLVKLNVADGDLERVIEVLPSMKSPTVSQLFGPSGGYAIETVVPKTAINVLIPELRDRGATDILELPLSKIVH
ncbi:MAG TPA: ATP phosphoribosyltransferase [Acidimicrobiales bacterium]|nr:ATP phosphoribosyltransferase [Acidimicrobiales bacterium]